MVLGIAGAIVFIGVLVKAVHEIRKLGWEPLKAKWISPLKARRAKIDDLIGAVEGLVATSQRIECELTTNGGFSLKDMVNRIDRKVEYLQARSRYQDDASSQAMFELDAHGELTKANAVFCALLDSDERELLHRNYVAKAVAADRPRLLSELNAAIDNKMPIDTVIAFQIDREVKRLRLHAKPNVRSGGELLGYFGRAEVLS